MQITIPHQLSNDEIRTRMDDHAAELVGSIAQVSTSWHGDEHLDLDILAMGQRMTGEIALAPGEVIITINLPPSLIFMEGSIKQALTEKAHNLLA